MTDSEQITFSFGENWRNYLDHSLNAERLVAARNRTCELLRLTDMTGLTFLDIGCGSGLFSYIAHTLGAARVISLDVDPFSVECCRYMRKRAGDPPNWEVLSGSILDTTTLNGLPQSDIVYSWGVLHHTGDMWQAIRNAAALVRPGGRFAIAIYNRLQYDTLTKWRGSHKWLRIKRLYNRSGWLTKRLLEGTLAFKDIAAMTLRLRNPLSEIRNYREKRGMSWWYDIVDWLGGYPYEFASAGEVFNYCRHQCGMQLEWMSTVSSIGCHEFLFVLPESRARGGLKEDA